MSAQLSQHVSTRLLIAEKSENAAHELDSCLRDAGIATKLSISDDLAHIAQTITQGEADIVLLTDKIDGLENIDRIIDISQAPIGRTPRSTPATYAGLFTPSRELFAGTQEARSRGAIHFVDQHDVRHAPENAVGQEGPG